MERNRSHYFEPGERFAMEYKLKRIGVLSLGLLVGVMSGILALLFAWPLIFLDLIGAAGIGTATFLTIVVLSFVGGFVSGAIVAVVYNVLFSLTGGLTLEFEEVRG